jgi:hypothetical protein
MQLKPLLDECKQRFNLQGVCRHNLCISHVKRVRLNAQCNGYLKQPGAVLIKAPEQRKGQLCAPQDMWVWSGLELLGCTRTSKRIKNNVVYTVTAIDEDAQTLLLTTEAESLTLSFEQASAMLRLSYARTYASVQGQEFSESLALHDTRNKHFTMKHLYVALSRAKLANLVAVRD